MKYKIFILTILASVGFFNYHGLVPLSIQKAMLYLMVMVSAVISLKEGFRIKEIDFPKVPYVLMMAFMCISIIMATAFHQQGIVTSVVTTMTMVIPYAYFPILLNMNLESEKIMKIYLWLCGAATIVYFCNVLTVPFNIFGEPLISMDMSRGIIRLPVVFIEIFPLIVFYSINKWIDTKEKKWLVILGVAVLMIFLSVIRQIIALTAVLGLWFFFRQVSVWKKVLLIVVALGVVVFVLPQIPMYKTMIELSEDQADENADEENIRITAWRYYTYENQTNAISPILGNGIPAFGQSLWGRMMDSETDVNHCFAFDVGWAGYFWFFGIIATASLMILLGKAALKRKRQDRQYLTYWFIFIIITSVASAPILYFWQIISISVCLAMAFQPEKEESDYDVQEAIPESNDHQYNRYPQL